MSFLPEDYNFGKEMEDNEPRVVETLDEMYRDIAENANTKPRMVIRASAAPTSSDSRYPVGTFWLDQSGPTVYILDSKTNPSTASWTALN